METAIKRQKKSKNPNFTPAIGKNTTFSKQRQPTGLQKSLGHRKKKLLNELLNLALSSSSDKVEQMHTLVMELTGVSEKEAKQFTIEEAINLSQMYRAFNRNDAYNSLMNRVYGAPTQSINQPINIKVTITPRPEPVTPVYIHDYTVEPVKQIEPLANE